MILYATFVLISHWIINSSLQYIKDIKLQCNHDKLHLWKTGFDKNERAFANFYPLRGIVFFSLWEKWGTTKGTNLRFNTLFRYECAPSFRNLPSLCILHKTVPHYRGKLTIHWENVPGSTVPIQGGPKITERHTQVIIVNNDWYQWMVCFLLRKMIQRSAILVKRFLF